MSAKVECVLRFDAEVGEGPAWSVEDQALYWIDIHRCTINRLDPATAENKVWDLPAMPGCFVFREGGGALIPARDGIYDLDFGSGALRRIVDPPYDPAQFRFNDGRCDRQGRLWVGTQPIELSELGKLKAALYRYDGASLEPVVDIDMANGLAFSPDGRTMYRAETAQRVIHVYDFDPVAGRPTNGRVFVSWPRETPDFGAPDGATVDSKGGYWVALPAAALGGSIARFTPDGQVDVHFETPVPAPTMPAFGGPHMSTLYFTSGRFAHIAERPGSEWSGSIFAIETKFRGVPEPKFRSVV